MVLFYDVHVRDDCRNQDGKLTSEVPIVKSARGLLVVKFARTPTIDFGLGDLKAVRDAFVPAE